MIKAMMVTTSRADYGLLYPLIKEMLKSDVFSLSLVATGSHLSKKHGMTSRLIEADGIKISATISVPDGDSSPTDILNKVAHLTNAFAAELKRQKPDLVIVLGDRYELWSIAISSVVMRIPIVHLYGGESTQGVIDEAVRHSVSKMASIHFVSLDAYRKRLTKMGEKPENVHVVGAIGIDNIWDMDLMEIDEISEVTGLDFKSGVALLTYHPVTLDKPIEAKNQIIEVMEAMRATGLKTLLTMPNMDTGNDYIYEMLKNYVQEFPEQFTLKKSLGQRGYLSALKHAKVLVGNSSSGIIESPAFGLSVVNIGDRQLGRIKAPNVIDVPCVKESIIKGISEALTDDFKRRASCYRSFFGDGSSGQKMIKILSGYDFSKPELLIKKSYYDGPEKKS